MIAVHPHVCGERILFSKLYVRHVGSSPRVWGTLHLLIDSDSLLRFIPTCVGNACSRIAQK